MDNNKISVMDYLEDNSLLTASYIPFDEKMSIVSKIMSGLINTIGGLNTSMLRRISTEVFIESITNIDMKITDENGLSGFDQLCYKDELDNLKNILGNEYEEFERILDERVDDYVRTETNPAITINAIYSQVADMISKALELISQKVKDIDVEELTNNISQLIPKTGGVENEGE